MLLLAGWAHPHQSAIRTMPHRHGHRPNWWNEFSWGSHFPGTSSRFKLEKVIRGNHLRAMVKEPSGTFLVVYFQGQRAVSMAAWWVGWGGTGEADTAGFPFLPSCAMSPITHFILVIVTVVKWSELISFSWFWAPAAVHISCLINI